MRFYPFKIGRFVVTAAGLCAVLLAGVCLPPYGFAAPAQSGAPAVTGAQAVDPGPSAVTVANRDFEQAWSQHDTAAVDRELEPDFTWIDPSGVMLNRAEALGNWPTLAAVSNSGEVTEHVYGRVGLVQIHALNTHVLRIYVDDGKHGGWKLLHIIDTVEAKPFNDIATIHKPEAVVPTESGVETDCINPCRVVPFLPATSNERAALAAWQQMEIGAASQDMKEWGRHVADEAMIVDPGGAVSKADRIEGTHEHEGTAKRTNEAPPLVGAHMIDLGDVVIMLTEQQPYDGQPFRATYVWVNRDGRFQMVVSYHTTIREVPAFALTDQLDDPPPGR